MELHWWNPLSWPIWVRGFLWIARIIMVSIGMCIERWVYPDEVMVQHIRLDGTPRGIYIFGSVAGPSLNAYIRASNFSPHFDFTIMRLRLCIDELIRGEFWPELDETLRCSTVLLTRSQPRDLTISFPISSDQQSFLVGKAKDNTPVEVCWDLIFSNGRRTLEARSRFHSMIKIPPGT